MAAFLAPLMATQATGTPEGICTIDSSDPEYRKVIEKMKQEMADA